MLVLGSDSQELMPPNSGDMLPASGASCYTSLCAEDIISVDHEAMTLTLAAGPIGFTGYELARSLPHCPAEGLTFKFAGSLHKMNALKATLKLKQTGSRCAEQWIPDAKFKERLTSRHAMLKGEKGDSRFPWQLVSAVYTEYSGVKVNFADELGMRMLQALAALKAGAKSLNYEQQILQHINRSGAQASGAELARVPVVPKEETLEVGFVASTDDVMEREQEQEQVGLATRPARSSKRTRQTVPPQEVKLDDDATPVSETHDAATEMLTDVKNLSLEVGRGAVAEQVEIRELREETADDTVETPPPTRSPSSELVCGGKQSKEEEFNGKKDEGSLEDHADPVLQGFKQMELEMKTEAEGEGNSLHTPVPGEHGTTDLGKAQEKLRLVGEEKDALVESLRQATASLTQLELEQSRLLREWKTAKEQVSRQIATGNMAVVDGLKQELSCIALHTANLGKMHVKRRRLDEQKVSPEERDRMNRAQIWELEQAVVDRETSVSALLEQWATQYSRCEEATLAEEEASNRLRSNWQMITDLRRGNSTIHEELQIKASEVLCWTTQVMHLKHQLTMAEYHQTASKPPSTSKKNRKQKKSR